MGIAGSRSKGSNVRSCLRFALALLVFAVAFLVVIPEGDLLLFSYSYIYLSRFWPKNRVSSPKTT
jgi:hypothetical protein